MIGWRDGFSLLVLYYTHHRGLGWLHGFEYPKGYDLEHIWILLEACTLASFIAGFFQWDIDTYEISWEMCMLEILQGGASVSTSLENFLPAEKLRVEIIEDSIRFVGYWSVHVQYAQTRPWNRIRYEFCSSYSPNLDLRTVLLGPGRSPFNTTTQKSIREKFIYSKAGYMIKGLEVYLFINKIPHMPLPLFFFCPGPRNSDFQFSFSNIGFDG